MSYKLLWMKTSLDSGYVHLFVFTKGTVYSTKLCAGGNIEKKCKVSGELLLTENWCITSGWCISWSSVLESLFGLLMHRMRQPCFVCTDECDAMDAFQEKWSHLAPSFTPSSSVVILNSYSSTEQTAEECPLCSAPFLHRDRAPAKSCGVSANRAKHRAGLTVYFQRNMKYLTMNCSLMWQQKCI